jgi:putative Holliday junction resolvase
MALDVGDKNIGIAISDALLLTAQSRPTLRRATIDRDLEWLKQLAEENEVHRIIIGQPLHMTGGESPQGRKIAAFAQALEETLGIPVSFWDERLTSFAAEQHLEEMGLGWRQRRKQVDKIAAMIILQEYLDSLRSSCAPD